jgi:hypothetical protein
MLYNVCECTLEKCLPDLQELLLPLPLLLLSAW